MHSLGTITLEAQGGIATPAVLIAQLTAALDDLVTQVRGDAELDPPGVDTHAARKALELATAATWGCSCGSRLPIDRKTRAVPAHRRPGTARQCGWSGSLLQVTAIPAPVRLS